MEKNEPSEYNLSSVNPILYENSNQLIQFLNSYFLIKPQLLSSESFGKFRIVVQNLSKIQMMRADLDLKELPRLR